MFPGSLRTFEDDLTFLRSHVDTLCLENREGAVVAVVPVWQGRIVTSAVSVHEKGYGWINDSLIREGRLRTQANLYGGEDRLWLAPEGGQFSLFFERGVPFQFANWRCPAVIDTAPFEVLTATKNELVCRQQSRLLNYSGTEFSVDLLREIKILERDALWSQLGIKLPPEVAWVGHESNNRMTNVGAQAWNSATGLPALWILGMFKPSASVTMVVPYRPGLEADLGPVVTSNYFGTLGPDRLAVGSQAIWFRGDGAYRSKIGLSALRATPLLGSWDDERGTLTVVHFSLPSTAETGYVNNLWEIQSSPFSGDAVNGYNDGPNESGECLGPFYELETLSPALALAPGESYLHAHRTFHFEGPRPELSAICSALLGVTIDEITAALPARP